MPLTLLLDLDDTLLDTNLSAFVPAYFKALAQNLAPHISPDLMSRALLLGTGLMNQSEDFSNTLSEVFYQAFYGQLPVSREELQPAIENFYNNIFPSLRGLTAQKPEAKPFVEWALAQGFRVAIATDPLLPRKATHQRLRWAGFEADQFPLVSTFEEFHFSKTFPAYYAEVLGRLGWPEGPVLMVGNDLERDILPAKRLGLATFLVDDESASTLGSEAGWRGSFPDLRRCLESVDLATLTPSFKSKEAVMGILLSTPAVLNGLLEKFDDWARKPSADDWTLTELICHLRDTEREIHHMQLRLFTQQETPFIPRPDTGVWASQRDYFHEDGRTALIELNTLRRETIEMLKNADAETWERKARHAIFGPTTFLEVVGFIAEHDRLHIQQAWSILRGLS
ncbi:MAG TPA: DinB family protein [Anaerolineales bacterium]|nr:DinB family protein [Anaerolineales bacterium]HNN13576.1 DinB family protein [Anaerolineales bacterium]